MELSIFSLDGMTLGSVVAGIAQAFLTLAASIALRWAKGNRFFGRAVFLAGNRFMWRSLATAVFSFGSALIVSIAIQNVSVPLLGTATFALLALYYQLKFSVLGLHGAQLSVGKGTNYRSALNLCRNRFSLLGTGAFKLTQEKNFEETLRRCNHDVNPVRFLLSMPDNKVIVDAEKKAGVMVGSYRENVIKSLKILKRLREESGAKFEVRFYHGYTERDFENFRMMFIDDDILLLSYNVYGSGGGVDAGQIVLFKSRLTSSTRSFFFAYENYFERLWSTSEPWDYKAYVQ